MKQQLAGAAVLVWLVNAACTGPSATVRPAPAAPAEARESLRAADAALSQAIAARGSAEGLADSATHEALLLLKGVYTLRGREALRAHLAAHPLEEGGGTLRAEAVRWDVSADGRLGYSVGQAVLEKSGEPQPRYVRYLAVWTRTPDGPWRLAAATFNHAPGPLEVPASHPASGAGTPPATPMSPADTLAEAFAADSAFSRQSVEEGMGIAFPAWATEDAMLSGAGLFGREAIARAYAPFTLDKVKLRWEPRLGGAAASGDLAYTVGFGVSVSPTPDGQSRTGHVKYLSLWRRQPDGSWRWVADQGNGNPGPDGP
jgi:ketosteroid isomerase-like protein